MHSSCSPPPSRRVILLFLYHIVSLVPEVTTHYHTRRHSASPSLNCFPSPAKGRGQERPPRRHVLADDRPLKCENGAEECFLSLHASFESARGNGGEKKARQFTSGHRGVVGRRIPLCYPHEILRILQCSTSKARWRGGHFARWWLWVKRREGNALSYWCLQAENIFFSVVRWIRGRRHR